MGAAYQRGTLLFNQKRYAMAADEFRKELAQSPNDAGAMAMLALSVCYDGKLREALAQAKAAVAADPNRAFVHYALACVMIGPPTRWTGKSFFRRFRLPSRILPYRWQVRRARGPAMEAVRLDPYNAGFLGLMSAIALDLGQPMESLEWAEKGLAVCADHVRCTSMRARALARLGRAVDARATIQGALALDPDSASTHCEGGWTHLAVGDPDRAIKHFAESVRLNPNDASAHHGVDAARRAAAALAARKVFRAAIVLSLVYMIVRAAFNPSSDLADRLAVLGFAAMIGVGCALAAISRFRRGRP
jgi:tetratricopeptide (TPR) repeat protein